VRSGSTSGSANRRSISDSRVAAGVVQERRATAIPFLIAMRTQLSTAQIPTRLEGPRATTSRDDADAPESMSPLAIRVHGEYREMPGLRLTVRQAARLFSLAPDLADAVLQELRRASILACSTDGAFALVGEPSSAPTAHEVTMKANPMNTQIDAGAPVDASLKEASLDRLACLLRHWAWADEARAAFDRELANGWDEDDDPMSDHPFGSYYHWCALLCGFSEEALEHGLLSPSQLDAIHQDLELSRPALRACRQLLIVIPASLEEQPRILDLLGDEETLGRLRRVHAAFGEALRDERMSREVDSLDH
jgi:hypothetical protein